METEKLDALETEVKRVNKAGIHKAELSSETYDETKTIILKFYYEKNREPLWVDRITLSEENSAERICTMTSILKRMTADEH